MDKIKTAVITGGGSGIGKCAVIRLLSEGWTVWALDNSEASLGELASACADKHALHTCTCDVSSSDSIQNAFDLIKQTSDSIDALICSAGVIHTGSLESHSPEQVDRLLDVNIKGPWLTVRQALPLLRIGASIQDPSRVVLVGSIGGIRPKVGSGMYSATKAALHVLTGVYAVELGADGITVNAVAPGTVDTPMVRALAEANSNSSYKPSGDSPLGRVAQPEDIVDAIGFFLSDGAKYVNGAVLPVDGGTRAAFVKV